MRRINILILFIFFFACSAFSDDSEYSKFQPISLMEDQRIFLSNDGRVEITLNTVDGLVVGQLKDNISGIVKSIKLPPAEYIPFVKLFEKEGVFILSAGGSYVYDEKLLIAYNLLTGSPLWNLPIKNDFFVYDIAEKGSLLPIGLINNGIVFVLDVRGDLLLEKKIFERLYFAGICDDNLVIAFGTDNYKSSIFKIKLFNLNGDIIREIPGFHEGDKFFISPTGRFLLSYSGNSFYNDSSTITVLDLNFEKTEIVINPKYRPACVIFSNDGDYIFAASGYGDDCILEIFNLSGEKVYEYKIITNEIYIRSTSIIQRIDHIEVVLGKSEM